jgi:hypothetical protein
MQFRAVHPDLAVGVNVHRIGITRSHSEATDHYVPDRDRKCRDLLLALRNKL